MSTRSDILPTRNPGWGFYGTMERAGANPETAWRIASALIAITLSAEEPKAHLAAGIRDFLDSRDGRHFADMVAGFTATAPGGHSTIDGAILQAIRKYQELRIHQRMARSLGIVKGQPYLGGLVHYYADLAVRGEEV